MLLSLDRKYKAHYIHPNADQDPHTKRWTLRVLISWEENGDAHYRTLYGPPDQFDDLRDAIKYAVDLAINWIDGGKSDEKKSA
jgi:hypothetical protein